MVDRGVNRPQIRAAGAVLWREDRGKVEIAVEHRPRYDDWSLPKGKLEPGDTVPAAAVREVAEETGFGCVLGPFLTQVTYLVRSRDGEAEKVVDYFSARAVSGAFATNTEVDKLQWLDLERARESLSYPLDVRVLDEFTSLGPYVRTMLLVRHGKAGSRDQWDGDDDLRPLSETGIRQAEALRAMLPLFGPDRVHSAPAVRCVQTVRGVADDLGVEVVHEPSLSEDGFPRDPVRAIARLRSLVDAEGTPVVCSQGAVIPDVVGAFAQSDGVPLESVAAKKGSLWLLCFAAGSGGPGGCARSGAGAERSEADGARRRGSGAGSGRGGAGVDGPRLLRAHYLKSALPDPVATRSG